VKHHHRRAVFTTRVSSLFPAKIDEVDVVHVHGLGRNHVAPDCGCARGAHVALVRCDPLRCWVEFATACHVQKDSLDSDRRVSGLLELPPDGSAMEDALEGQLCAVFEVTSAQPEILQSGRWRSRSTCKVECKGTERPPCRSAISTGVHHLEAHADVLFGDAEGEVAEVRVALVLECVACVPRCTCIAQHVRSACMRGARVLSARRSGSVPIMPLHVCSPSPRRDLT